MDDLERRVADLERVVAHLLERDPKYIFERDGFLRTPGGGSVEGGPGYGRKLTLRNFARLLRDGFLDPSADDGPRPEPTR